jgi:hypothetical protein
MYTSTGGQEFNVGNKTINGKDYDEANRKFSKMELPFHSFATVEKIQ